MADAYSSSQGLDFSATSSDESTAPGPPELAAPAPTDLPEVECLCEECSKLAPWLNCAQANALRGALNNVLDWRVGGVLGIGGISVCFEAQNCERAVAVKVSHNTANNEFVARVAQDEKEVLEDLHLAGCKRGIPEVYSTGSVTVDDCTHHYIVMQRLGSNLDVLIRQNKIGRSNFVQYALGMLEAVETVHEAGWVHLDIKPGNFCVNNDLWDPAEDKVYIIDFGGAQRAPTVEKSDDEYIYFGTADYSGSMAMMQYMMPGPSDDIESLCYSFLHMWIEKQPWTVTEGFKLGADGWAKDDIMAMLKLRTRKWKRLCQSQAIPLFLQQLHVYAMSLKTHEMADYENMRRLIMTAQAKPVQLPAAVRTKRRASEPAAEVPRKHMRACTADDAHLLQLEE